MRLNGMTLAFCVLLGSAIAVPGADAAPHQQGGTSARSPAATHRPVLHRTAAAFPHRAMHGRSRAATASGGISCVPYARAVTGMAITGNGGDWWNNAAGLYDRGQRPEPGSVMAFRSSGGMSRGHVAVVRRVLGPREVLIDHANWAGPGIRRGTVMHDVAVVDVSERNDWTAVKVQVGHDGGLFGRTYPTYGFIHNRPDTGAGTAFAGLPLYRSARFEQVAEAPEARMPVVLRPDAPEAPTRRR